MERDRELKAFKKLISHDLPQAEITLFKPDNPVKGSGQARKDNLGDKHE